MTEFSYRTGLPGAILQALAGGDDRVVEGMQGGLRIFGRNFQGFPAVELRMPTAYELQIPEDSYGLQFLTSQSETSKTLVVVCRTPYQVRAFLGLVDDALYAAMSQESVTQSVGAFLETIAEYRTLFDSATDGKVDPSVLRGFIGEVLTLFHLVQARGLSLGDAIRGWKGPWGAPRDFVFPEGPMCEVKTVRVDGRQVTISSLEQLNVMDRPLELVVVELDSVATDDEGGFVLSDLVRRIEREVASSPEDLTRLHQAMRLVGIDYRLYDDERFRRGKCMTWSVGESFPALTRSDVPREISGVTYTIDLGLLPRPDCITS